MFVSKWDNDSQHDLLAHLLDIAAVTFQLVSNYLPPAASQAVSELFSKNAAKLSPEILFFAAMHDIGKATPAFQAKCPAAVDQLVADGYYFPKLKPTAHFHAYLSATIIRNELPLIWPECKPKLPALVSIAKIVGGHHGLFPDSIARVSPDALGMDVWVDSRAKIIQKVAQIVGLNPNIGPSLLGTVYDRSLAILAGLVTVADWIGSMSEYFPFRKSIEDPERYWLEAIERAKIALESEGWRDHLPPPLAGQMVRILPAGARQWSSVQQLALQATEAASGPAIFIVESSTGSGKTEASWLITEASWRHQGACGAYIAMPTMATSNQLYDRYRRYLGGLFATQDINLVLAHSQASLQRWQKKIVNQVISQDAGTTEYSIDAERWFLPRKRSLLAPFGVGTVDQGLLAVMQVRHFFVRLFGLSGKTIIFDEVHAYDTYMTALFERLLEWLAQLGCTVIVLSATLPRSRKASLLEAYSGVAPSVDSLSPTAPSRITFATRNNSARLLQSLPGREERRRVVRLEWIGSELESVFRWIKDVLSEGGCCVWICSTVREAQERFQTWKDSNDDDQCAIYLFHARYPASQRNEIEKSIVDLFGKKAAQEGRRPFKAVLFATQVVEQSLDLDFDVMVSDIAPVDLLIQREGRLQRHRLNRQESLGSVRRLALAIERPHPDSIPELGSSGFVYDRSILLRTLCALDSQGMELALPDSTDELVEAVYGEEVVAAISPAWEQAIESATEKSRERYANEVQEATSRLLPSPSAANAKLLKTSNRALTDDEDQVVHRSLVAATRLGDPSVSVVFLPRSTQGILHVSDNDEQLVPLENLPDDNLACRIAERAIRVSVPEWNHQPLEELYERSRTPEGWRKHPLLKNLKLVEITEGRAIVAGVEFSLDEKIGLSMVRLAHS